MLARGYTTALAAATVLGAAVGFAQDTARSDKAALEAIKKAAEKVDVNRLWKLEDEKAAAAAAAKHADEVHALLKEFTDAHAKSELLAEARRRALRVGIVLSRFINNDDEFKRIGELARTVRDAGPAGSDDAALGQLSLNQLDLLRMVRNVRTIDDFRKAWARDEADFTRKCTEFLKAYPKNREGVDFYSAELLGVYDDMLAEKLRSTVLGHIRDHFAKDHPLARTARLEAKVGKEFEFKFTVVGSGKEMSIADFRGKVLVIDFWATWCGPCKAEMPHMKKLYAEFKDKGVEFLGVSSDDELAPLTRYVKANQIGWPQVHGPAAEKLTVEWAILGPPQAVPDPSGIPTIFVVDKKGVLRSTQARGRLEQWLPKLLAEN
jgi:thiol-disulfide isomerase/thioredoxin